MVGHQPLELLAGVLAAAIGVMQQRIGLPRRQIAITRASVTSCAVIAVFIDEPTTRHIPLGPQVLPRLARPAKNERY